LGLPLLKWYVSQQSPPDQKRLSSIDSTADLAAIATSDQAFIHLKAFDLPPQDESLALNTAGIVELGELLGRSYMEQP